MDNEKKARSWDDCLPEFGQNVPGRSRPGLAVASSCTEERASNIGGKLRFAA